MKRAVFLVVLSLLGVALTGCGGGSNGSGLLGAGSDEGTGSPFAFGALSGRASSTNPPITTNGTGATVTAIKGDISSLFLNDTSNNLAETRIAFDKNTDGSAEIYLMNVDGTNLQRLTNNSADDTGASWKPDGQYIAFQSSRDGDSDIYIMAWNGSSLANITNNVGANDNHPAWSPDGQWIAFDSLRLQGATTNHDIYKIRTNGTGEVRLTTDPGIDDSPAWSPDGKKIAFHSNRSGNDDIWVMDSANGANQVNLTNHPDQDGEPAWSPDGTMIAFSSARGGNTDIYVMNVNGSNQRQVTTNTDVDMMPDWSPDGSKIIFVRQNSEGREIFTINLDGTNETRVTNNTPADSRPAWGPFITQKRTLIGTNGLLSNSGAAGFFFSRGNGNTQGYGGNGEVINSVLTFDANPRSAVVLTSQSVPNNTGPTLVFSIDVDSPNTLTKLAYANSPDYRANQIIPASGLAMANGALVDFSATTGKVTAVLPFGGTRGAGKPTVTMEGGQQILRGSFLGVWDATGKNLAPNGATEVRLDSKTGVVASYK